MSVFDSFIIWTAIFNTYSFRCVGLLLFWMLFRGYDWL